MQKLFTTWTTALGAVCCALFLSGCHQDDGAVKRQLGHSSKIGNGSITSFIDLTAGDVPVEMGLIFPASSLSGLPEGSDEHHCYDSDDDGSIDAMTECTHSHEWIIPMPGIASRHEDIPYTWAMVNWNDHGHGPPMVYDTPHFDVHYYMAAIEDITAIEEGECGQGEPVRCDHYERGNMPVPEKYMPAGYQSLGAVAPGMGNHLIALGSPEFNGEAFTRTWIYGAYDGAIIFGEEMMTLDYLLDKPDACFPIAQPVAFLKAGFYPRQSCIRYDFDEDEYTISIRDFEYQEAS